MQKTKPANARTKTTEIAKPKSRTANNKHAVPSVPPPLLDDRTIGIVSSPVGMRSISSVGSSSSPSSPSVSVSSRSTSKSDKNKSVVRPPPGLTPPPGFASGGFGRRE